jgi:hypothetical protein
MRSRLNLYIAIIIGCIFGILIDAIVTAPLGRDVWFRNSIYGKSICEQIDEYKETKDYKLYEFEMNLKSSDD